MSGLQESVEASGQGFSPHFNDDWQPFYTSTLQNLEELKRMLCYTRISCHYRKMHNIIEILRKVISQAFIQQSIFILNICIYIVAIV